MLERNKGGCWSRRVWRENSGVAESCCVRQWSSDKFGRLDVEQRDGRDECWSVAALVAEENVNALAILMRGGGRRADTSTTGETAEAS